MPTSSSPHILSPVQTMVPYNTCNYRAFSEQLTCNIFRFDYERSCELFSTYQFSVFFDFSDSQSDFLWNIGSEIQRHGILIQSFMAHFHAFIHTVYDIVYIQYINSLKRNL